VHQPATEPNDLEKHFVERANAGDVEGLVALYEPNAIIAYGNGETAVGHDQIRIFLARFLADHPPLDPSNQAPALCSGEIALTSSQLSNGDITAEVARRQPEGGWLWAVDHFSLTRSCGTARVAEEPV